MSLSIDVPEETATAYQMTCLPLSSGSGPILPFSSQNPYLTAPNNSSSGGQNMQLNQLNLGLPNRPSGSQSSVNNYTGVQNIMGQGTDKELYWCIDKAWSEPRQTLVRTIADLHMLTDDGILCSRLVQEYKSVRGFWSRFFSWKHCLSVDFIKVRSFVFWCCFC